MSEPADSRTPLTLLRQVAQDPADTAAWRAFVHRYGRKIYLWCRAWGLQDADAEDVTQNVLLEVARKMRTFRYDPSGSFRGWLKTLTHAAWYRWRKNRRRQERNDGLLARTELLATAAAGADLEQRLHEEYERELLEQATVFVRQRVEPRTWEAFRLLALEGLSGIEVAARLEMKIDAVFVARSRVLKLLREEVSFLDSQPANPGR